MHVSGFLSCVCSDGLNSMSGNAWESAKEKLKAKDASTLCVTNVKLQIQNFGTTFLVYTLLVRMLAQTYHMLRKTAEIKKTVL